MGAKIRYQDADNLWKATVMKFNGTNWETVGSPVSAGSAMHISLALDGSGMPYISYMDVPQAFKITVKKFNGTNWETVGSPGFSAGSVLYTSLALDGGGTPYVSYRDNGSSSKVTVMKFNGTNWENVGSPGFSDGIATYTSLALNGSDTLYVTYPEGGNSAKATVMKFNGTSWENVGTVGFSGGSADYTSLALDGNGTPYVAYQDGGNSDKATVMRFEEPEIDVQRPGGISIGDGNTDGLGYQAAGTIVLDYVIDNSAGTADLIIPAGGVSASNYSNSSNFSVNTTLPLTIATGNTETLQISFDVDSIGAFSFDMDIANNDSDENPYDIQIRGAGAADWVIINEVDADTPGSDTAEFIEFYDGGVGNTSLDGLVLVFYNGGDDQTYASFDLDGLSTDANGYFVIGNAVVPNVDLIFGNGVLQNGADAVALYMGDETDFPSNTPVTTTNLIDALIYDTDDGDDAGLLVLLNALEPQINEDSNGSKDSESSQRCLNGTGGKRNTNTYHQAVSSPGESNTCLPEMDVQGNGVSIANNDALPDTADHTDFGGALANGDTVTRTFTIENSGVDVLAITLPLSVGGTHASDFTVTGQPDSTVSASGGTTTFTVEFAPGAVGVRSAEISIGNDDSDENPYTFAIQGTGVTDSVIINEVDADTTGTDTQEFIELYDGGSGNTSLSGLVTVFYNGFNNESYNAIDLDGFSTNAYGYFVIGNAAVPNVDLTFSDNTLQNGTDAVALYVGDSTDFPNDTPVTITDLIDAIIYETNDGDAPGLRILLNSGQPIVNETVGPNSNLISNQRCPNGTGGKRNTDTYDQHAPTPGEMNCPPEINIERPINTTITDGNTDAQGDKRSGEQSTLTYTVRNTGNSSLNISNITATGESNVSVGTITPTNFTVASGGGTATFDVPYTPAAGNGAFSFELDITNDDPDEGNYDITVSGTRDGIAPSVTAIDRADANPTNATSVDFDVTFSEAVSDIETGDFALALTGSASGTINNVSASSGTTVTVTANGISGSGTLGLNFDYDALDSVVDAVGNAAVADFTGQTYTIDNTAPSVTAIDRADGNPTSAASVDFDVTFSEAVSDIETGDFALALTGSANGTINNASASSGTTVTVTVNGISGDGTLGLNFDYDALDSVVDGVGNAATADFTGESYSVDNTEPSVTVEQASGQPDPANASPIRFDVLFSENVTGFDNADVNISGMAGVPGITVNGSNDTYTVEVTGMADGETIIATIPANVAQDEAGNDNLASTSTDNSVTYNTTSINILGGGIVGEPNSETIQNLSVHQTQFTSIEISFNADAADPSGDTDPDDVTNPNNFLLIQMGANSIYDTATCLDYNNNGDSLLGDDIQISTGPITYDAATFTATLTLNNGTPLPAGEYHLLVCGTTSITDAAGNALNNGNDVSTTFSITAASLSSSSLLPDTGFPHGGITLLPHQPTAKAYTDTAMTLEIPKLGISTPIVGVPQTESSWDVTWLGNSTGYLAGSAFPTWAGNTVITGHVWDAYNQPGVFAQLKSLRHGDQIEIHAWGVTYTYEVRESKLITKKNINAAFQSEEYDWVTLVTCEFYNPFNGDYLFRRAVRAVLVSVN